MNILLINHYAGSPDMGMEFRPYYMAREWTRAGHDVTIVAGDYSHLRIKNPDVQRDFQEQDIDGIRYVWVRTGEYEGNGATRALSMFRFVRKLRAHARELVSAYRPDAVIASSTYPLDTYAAQKIRKLSGAKYVHEIHDMWPATLYEIGGMSRRHPFVMLMQVAENSFCRNADAVVSLLGGARDYLVEHGMAPDKFVHIINGVVEEEWQNPRPIPDEHRKTIESLHDEGKFIVGYFGGHALSNALDRLLDIAMEMKERRDVTFVLVGKGVEKPRLQERARAEGLDNVVFLPPVDKLSVPDLLGRFDCIIIVGEPSGLAKYGGSLNKLFDSMMSGKPIVMAGDSSNSLVAQYGCGIVIPPLMPKAATSAICELMEMGASQRAVIGEKGQAAVRENYTYRSLAKRFLDAMS